MEPPKIWHPEQEKILKRWGENSACYRFLHYKSYQKFRKSTMRYTLPIIIISTITGTANFAHESFPDNWKEYVPLFIGAFNLFGGILSTVQQFLKVNELMESHRVSSIHYGKLSRTIRLELSLPLSERSYNGVDMIEFCKVEYDRLIEQSPPISGEIMKLFEEKFPDKSVITEEEFSRPEITTIHPINTYDGFYKMDADVQSDLEEIKIQQ